MRERASTQKEMTMRTLILGISAAVLTIFSASAAMAGGLDAWKADCIAKGATNIYQIGGQWKCDAGSGKVPTPTPKQVNYSPAYTAFKSDCDAQGGTIYEAAQWNQMEPAKRLGFLQPGQMKCYKGASWTKD